VLAILDSKKAAVLNIIACNLGSKADRNAIPMANPTFSESMNPLKTLFRSGVGAHGRWIAPGPEIMIIGA